MRAGVALVILIAAACAPSGPSGSLGSTAPPSTSAAPRGTGSVGGTTAGADPAAASPGASADPAAQPPGALPLRLVEVAADPAHPGSTIYRFATGLSVSGALSPTAVQSSLCSGACGWTRQEVGGELFIAVYISANVLTTAVVTLTLPDGRVAATTLDTVTRSATSAPGASTVVAPTPESSAPAPASASAAPSPGAAQAPTTSAGLQVLASFPGVEYAQNPPDVDIAAGPSSILLTTNGEYVLRDKAGALLARMPTRAFYAGPLGLVGGGVVDSEILYDELSGRFFIGASGSSGDGPWSAFLVAVSKSSDPRTLTTADWLFYALDGRIDRLADGDHPTSFNVDGTALTVAANVVVMTARMESNHLGGTPDIKQYLKVRVMDKAAALNGSLSTWRDIVGVTFPGSTNPAMGVAPAHAVGRAERVYLSQPTGCGFAIWSIDDAYPPSPVVSTFAPLASGCVGNYARQPVDAPQPGGAPPLAVSSSGSRSFKGTLVGGHLYLTHLTGWDGPNGPTNAIRFAEVDLTQWPRAFVVQQSIITADDVTVFYPALAVDRSGDVALVYGRSGAAEAASIWLTGRASTDASGTLRSPLRLRGGAGAFVQLVYGVNRWADYFGAALDPVDGTIWVSGQYPTGPSSSATWVANVRVSR